METGEGDGKLPERAKRPQPPGGSRKGVPNKATADVRHAIALVAQLHVDKLGAWITAIATGQTIVEIDGERKVFQKEPDPARAADIFLRAVEYHIPKLRSVEGTMTIRRPEDDLADEELVALIERMRASRPKVQAP